MDGIAFLSTYPPRECGLATFTQDLVEAIGSIRLDKNFYVIGEPRVIAVSNGNYSYNNKVIMELDQHNRDSYYETAQKINSSGIQLLVIQHEYGIYGGDSGEYILDLANRIKIPIFVVLHTVLPNPQQKQRQIINQLANKSFAVITMARNTVDILENVYGILRDKIAVIHHGVPLKPVVPRDELKKKFGLEKRHVVSTFGLLSPGKGLEYGIEAISKVVGKHENITYLILGQTHPCVKQLSQESYRESLVNMVEKIGLHDNVKFINKYLSIGEIINYLQLSDIYMTPYLGKDQAVSGTLAYAVGYGRVIVSTPYIYAQEMLGEGRGLLTKFRDSESIANSILYIIENPKKQQEMENKTADLGKTMMWNNVANQYMNLFTQAILNKIEVTIDK